MLWLGIHVRIGSGFSNSLRIRIMEHCCLQVQVDPGAAGEEVSEPEVQVRGG